MTHDEYMQYVNQAPGGGGGGGGGIQSLLDSLGINLSGIDMNAVGGFGAGLAGNILGGPLGGVIGSGAWDAATLYNRQTAAEGLPGIGAGNLNMTPGDYLRAALPNLFGPSVNSILYDRALEQGYVRPEYGPQGNLRGYWVGSDRYYDAENQRVMDRAQWLEENPEVMDRDITEGPTFVGDDLTQLQTEAEAARTPTQTELWNQILGPQEIGTDISTPGNIYDEPAAWQEMADQLRQYGQENYGPLMPPQEPIPPIEQGPLSSSPIPDFAAPTPFYTPESSSGAVLSQPASPISPVADSGQNVYDWIDNLRDIHDVVPDASGTALTVEREDASSPSLDEITQSYEDQYGDYGGWYGAKGGTVSAFAGGGPATEHGKRLKADKGFWKKHGKDFLEKLADKMSQLSPEARKEAETELFKNFPMGLYSSKIAEIWPEEYAPFSGKDLEGEPIPVPVPEHYHRELFQGGGMVRGPGAGMDDMVPATIEGREMAKLSNDEFVIPADVVSDLGDGSSNAGHKKLYQFISDIRQAKTGNSSQPPKLMSALRGLNENARGKRSTFISDVINMKKAINAGDNEDRSYAAEYIRAIKSVMEAR